MLNISTISDIIRAIELLRVISLFPGEGKRRMNDQQGRELPFSARQVVPGQLSYRQLGSGQLSYPKLRRRRRRFVRGINLLIIASLLIILVIGIYSIQLNHHGQQPTLTTHATFNSQTVLIASQVDHLLTNEATHQQFSGSVLIAYDGQVLLRKGYSMANWGKKAPNTPHTRFYLGSTTKQFTAMAILILQQQGKLQVHNHICSYISPCPPAWQPVTIHELLTHTSGIPEFDDASVSNASPRSWINDFDD